MSNEKHSAEIDVPDCRCPNGPTGGAHRRGEHKCDTCGGFACGYADKGRTRCPAWRCDCFIATHPDSPMDLHPEVFTVATRVVTPPEGGQHD